MKKQLRTLGLCKLEVKAAIEKPDWYGIYCSTFILLKTIENCVGEKAKFSTWMLHPRKNADEWLNFACWLNDALIVVILCYDVISRHFVETADWLKKSGLIMRSSSSKKSCKIWEAIFGSVLIGLDFNLQNFKTHFRQYGFQHFALRVFCVECCIVECSSTMQR